MKKLTTNQRVLRVIGDYLNKRDDYLREPKRHAKAYYRASAKAVVTLRSVGLAD